MVRWLPMVAAALLPATSGCTGADPAIGGWGAGGDLPGLANGDDYEAAPALSLLSDDALADLAGDIDDVLASPAVASTAASIHVVDLETGQELYAHDPDALLTPASNTKLFTTAAAFEILGEDLRFSTDITAASEPAAGVIHGDVVLRGGFDFSWSRTVLDYDEQGLDELVADLAAAGITAIDGTLYVGGEFLLAGESLGTYDAARERAEVADAVATALATAGISVGAIEVSPSAAEQGVTLARFDSPPLSVGATPLNRLSHNEFADVLARYLGTALGGDPAQWTSEVATWAAGFGAHAELYDGSGLSHDNRTSARSITSLIRFMIDRPEGPLWLRSFSVSGVDGTLAHRLDGLDTYGRVWGKTGTLNGVIATSGVLFNRYDGRRVAFSILMNDTTDAAATRAAQDDIIRALAADRRDDERPAAPVLLAVRRDRGAVDVTFTAAEDATGYLVWISDDGRTWRRDEARLVDATHYRSEPLAADIVYVRVSAVGARGESDASDTYAAASGERHVLVVDGNDRWQTQPSVENPMGAAHDFATEYARALLGRSGVDTVANEVVSERDVDLAAYDAVLWMTGEDGAEELALDETERARLQVFLDGGGKLMISGSEIGWHLVANGTSDEKDFFTTYLRADYTGDDSGTRRARPNGALFGTGQSLGFFTPSELVVGYPDRLAPTGGAVAALEYAGGEGGTAAITYQGEYSLVYFGFPFESIDSASDRRVLMGRIADFFDL